MGIDNFLVVTIESEKSERTWVLFIVLLEILSLDVNT
jgi:hypothetical protein